MFSYFYKQSGGGKCSSCGAPGVTKTTCPANPTCKNPKPGKHNVKSPAKTSKKTTGQACELGPGFKILDSASMTLNDTSLEDIQLPKSDLNKIVAKCNSIQLKLMSADDPFERTYNVTASNGSNVTVEDILLKFVENNRKLFEEFAAVGLDNLGNHVYYQGITHEGGNVFSMLNYGS